MTKQQANNRKQSTRQTQTSSNRTVQLIVRLALSTTILLAFIMGYVSFMNARVESMFNDATENLQRNARQIRAISADIELIYTRQQQVDAQFEQANKQFTVLLPHLAQRLQHNSALSKKFTQSLRDKLRDAKKNQQNATQQSHSSQTNNSQPTLNPQQRNQVESLLQYNNQQNNPGNTDTQSHNNDLNGDNMGQSNRSKPDQKPW